MPANQPQERRQRRPRGKAARWSEVEIAVLSDVGRTDVPAALQVWRQHAPGEWKELLSAIATIGQSHPSH